MLFVGCTYCVVLTRKRSEATNYLSSSIVLLYGSVTCVLVSTFSLVRWSTPALRSLSSIKYCCLSFSVLCTQYRHVKAKDTQHISHHMTYHILYVYTATRKSPFRRVTMHIYILVKVKST